MIGSQRPAVEPSFHQLFSRRRRPGWHGSRARAVHRPQARSSTSWVPRSHDGGAYFPSLSCSHDRLQGHAHHDPARPRSSPTWPTSVSSLRWPWCTPGSPPTPSPRGLWPTRSATSPTTARSTPSRATATGCVPARRCSAPICSPATLERMFPICTPDASRLGHASTRSLELLHLGGYDAAPRRADDDPRGVGTPRRDGSPASGDFYRYHASLMEPWDGPASIAFTDGTVIGAVLDRNGLRPSRYWVTDDDIVVMASEVGVHRRRSGSGGQEGPSRSPGGCSSSTPTAGRIVDDDEIKGRPRRGHPYGEWLTENLVELERPPDRSARAAPPGHGRSTASRSFGYTAEELGSSSSRWPGRGPSRSARWAPTPRSPCCRTDPGCCSTTSPSCSRRSRTRPSTPSVRSSSPPWVATIGPEGNLLDPQPRRAGSSTSPSRCSTTTSWRSSCTSTRSSLGFVALRSCAVSTRWPRGAKGCAVPRGPSPKASKAIADGADDPRAVRPGRPTSELAPIPSLLLTGAVHHHLIREGPGPRSASSSRPARPARCTHVPAARLRCGRGEPVPRVRDRSRIASPRDLTEMHDPIKARGQLHQGRQQGCHQGHVQDGHLDRGLLHRGADLRGRRPRRGRSSTSTSPGRTSSAGSASTRSPRRSAAATRGRYPVNPTERAHRELDRSAASTSGAARASTTSSTPRRCTSCSTPLAPSATRSSRSTPGRRRRRRRNWPRCVACSDCVQDQRPPVPIDEVEPVSEIVKRFSTGAMSLRLDLGRGPRDPRRSP